MQRRQAIAIALAAAIGAIGSGFALAGTGERPTSVEIDSKIGKAAETTSSPSAWHTLASQAKKRKPLKFASSELFIEINGTDGDAGLQLDLDGDAWRRAALFAPNGRKVLDIAAKSTLRGYGLTGLTFESSEPPFAEQPFNRFKTLFPEGKYTFRGTTIEGRKVTGNDRLTHDIPEMPTVTSPAEDGVVSANGFVVQWEPVTRPAGIEIELYEVIISGDEAGLDASLPPSATSLTVPSEVLMPGEYKVEVLAKEVGGNQIITEVAFTVE